jgi:hypothetical protein
LTDLKTQSWRDVLPVHPTADLFPLMSEPELRELGEDIKKNGLQNPIVLFEDKPGKTFLLDGRNRLDAMELVGIKFEVQDHKQRSEISSPETRVSQVYLITDGFMSLIPGQPEGKPDAYVVSANIHRRHLSADQKRDLIAKLLKANPKASDRTIAKQTKVDHKTVGKARAELEGRGEIPHVEKRTDVKGRKQPSAKPKLAKKRPDPVPAEIPTGKRVEAPAQTGEIDIEVRTALDRIAQEVRDISEGGNQLHFWFRDEAPVQPALDSTAKLNSVRRNSVQNDPFALGVNLILAMSKQSGASGAASYAASTNMDLEKIERAANFLNEVVAVMKANQNAPAAISKVAA